MRWLTLGFDLAACLRAAARSIIWPRVRARRVAAWKQSPWLFNAISSVTIEPGNAGPPQPGGTFATPRDQPAAAQHQAARQPFQESWSASLRWSDRGRGAPSPPRCCRGRARRVLLIEEGPFHELESCAPFSRQEMEQKYRNGGQTVALGANRIAYVEGCCVGGGSEINSGLYHRTPPEMLEQWRSDFQVEGLTEADLRPHFEACERDLTVSLLPGPAPAASLKLHTGAQRLGWKSLEVPRWFAYAPGAGNRGTRQSMTKTHLPRFLRAGGRLMAQTRVNRLSRDGRGWLLRATRMGASEVRIRAGTVFLCAGAVQTPALLRRSGLKPEYWRLAQAASDGESGRPVRRAGEFRGHGGAGASGQGVLAAPEFWLFHQSSGVCGAGVAGLPASLARGGPHLASYCQLLRHDRRRRARHGALPGPFRDPVVLYHLPEADLRSLAEGLRKLAELLLEAGAVNVYREPAVLVSCGHARKHGGCRNPPAVWPI